MRRYNAAFVEAGRLNHAAEASRERKLKMNASKKWMVSVVVLAVMVAAAGSAPARPASKAGSSPLKVYILAGQSNMEGAGAIKLNPKRNEGKGSLEYVVKDPTMTARTKHTVDAEGKFVVRKDVWICYGDRKGGLTAGYGARKTSIGPEFAFGHVMGEALDEQVLIIKTAWGGKSLSGDFRPPSSGGKVGPFYTEMLKIVKGILVDIKAHYPAYDGKGYEIAGFGWHQGWNDGYGKSVGEYEKNMANFIRDVRKALGVKNMPFVIATSGFGGWNQKVDRRLKIMAAQLAVAKYDEFKGNVFTVETRGFYRPPSESPGGHGYHWNENALTYFLIGEAMGKAMLKLSGKAPATAASHPDTTGAGWKDFLTADLSDTIAPKGVWSVTDGVLTATKDQNIWSKKQYEDFVIDLEFKTDEDTNSGVIVHCSNTKAWIPNSVEVQIADDHGKWEKAPKSWQCGAIFGHLPAARQKVVKKPGQWNRFTITCKGKIITVVLNGEQTCEMDMSKWTSAKKNPDGSGIPGWLSKPKAALPLKGHVGFQGKHAGAPIYFRNIRIKEL